MHRGRRQAHKDLGGPEPLVPKPDEQIRSPYRHTHIGGHVGKTHRVHRVVWEAANGPIPPDHCIHHIDGNGLNNSLENLVLMSEVEHGRIHGQHRGTPYRG